MEISEKLWYDCSNNKIILISTVKGDKIMKKTGMLLFVWTVVLTLFAATFVTSHAEEGGTVTPGAIVDYGTIWGYAEFLKNVPRDTEQLFTGEYTVHGMDGKVNYMFNKEGYTTFTPKEPLAEDGKDADGKVQAGDWRMTGELEFDPAVYNYIAVCYRMTRGAHISANQIYIRDDQHSGEFEGTVGLYTPNGLRADGEWQVRILEISKVFPEVKGTVKSLRIPITSRVGEQFDIQYMAAFASKEDAENFDYDAYKASVMASHEDEDAEWELNEDGTIHWIEKETPTQEPAGKTDASDTSSEKKEKSGCGSILGGSAAMLALLCGGMLLCRKKSH